MVTFYSNGSISKGKITVAASTQAPLAVFVPTSVIVTDKTVLKYFFKELSVFQTNILHKAILTIVTNYKGTENKEKISKDQRMKITRGISLSLY